MQIQSPRAVVNKFFDAVNEHSIDKEARSIFSERVELEGPGGLQAKGREQVGEAFRAYFKAFPDMTSETEDMVVSGSTVVTEGTLTGTHRGVLDAPGLNINPSGARIAVKTAHRITVRRGLISEIRFYMDRLELQEQLRAAA